MISDLITWSLVFVGVGLIVWSLVDAKDDDYWSGPK